MHGTLMIEEHGVETHCAKATRSGYAFHAVRQCNMCGSPAAGHRVLGKRLNGSQGWRPRRKAGVATTVQLCSDCGLIYPNPLPLPHNLQDHYRVAPEAYWDASYFTPDAMLFASQLSSFERLSGRRIAGGSMRALDIGAGIGKCLRALQAAGFDAYGLEPSESFHAAACARSGIAENRLQRAGVEDADYDEGFFDFITFGAVLEHLADPAASIERALRWVRPSGLIHVEVPSARWLVSRLANTFYRLIGTDYVTNLSPMHPPFHLYEFTLDSFRRHALQAGYEVAWHQFYVCQTFLPRPLDPLLQRLMEATNSGMQLEVWLRKAPQ